MEDEKDNTTNDNIVYNRDGKLYVNIQPKCPKCGSMETALCPDFFVCSKCSYSMSTKKFLKNFSKTRIENKRNQDKVKGEEE